MRKFLAKRIVNLLINHGSLETQIREIRLKQEESEGIEFKKNDEASNNDGGSSSSLLCHEVRACASLDSASLSSPSSSPPSSSMVEMSMMMVVRRDQDAHLELPYYPSWSMPLATIDGSTAPRSRWDHSNNDNGGHSAEQECAHHSILILLMASLVIMRHFKNKLQVLLKKKNKKWQEPEQPSSSRRMIQRVTYSSLVLARISFCLLAVALLVVLLFDTTTSSFLRFDKFISLLEENSLIHSGPSSSSSSLPRSLFHSSLWIILVSIIPSSSSALWSILNPASNNKRLIPTTYTYFGNAIIMNTKPSSAAALSTSLPSSWRVQEAFNTAQATAVAFSFGMIFWRAYLDLPFFQKVINGTLLSDMGVTDEIIHFLQQELSSFVAYCHFAKFLPTPPPSTDADRSSSPKEENQATIQRPTKKKYGCANPAIVQRMASLAEEAKARVEQRRRLIEAEGGGGGGGIAGLSSNGVKGGGGGGIGRGGMRRSYSVATFNPAKYHEEESICSTRGAYSSGIDTSPILCPSSVGRSRKMLMNAPRISDDADFDKKGNSSITRSPTLPPPPLLGEFSTPIRRRLRPSLTSLPELPHTTPDKIKNNSTNNEAMVSQGDKNYHCSPPYPPSPLTDINLAGPSLSSKDVFARLKKNDCLKISVSTGCLTDLPQSLLIPFPKEDEEKRNDDDDVDFSDESDDGISALPQSLLAPQSPVFQLDQSARSNPQSASTPVPRKEYLP